MSSAPDFLPEFQRYQYAFGAHIRDPRRNPRPDGASAQRMNVYNELVYHNLEGFLLACFPVLRKVMGKRKWDRLVRDFLVEYRCRTPIFRQIPEEFVRYLQEGRRARVEDPAYLAHLAHYEWIELALSVSPLEPEWAKIQPDGDLLAGRPVLNPVLALLTYPYAVQRIGPKYKPGPEQQQESHLLVLRDAADQVRFIELNPVSARLVDLLQSANLTGGQVLKMIAEELKHPDPAAVIEGGRAMLKKLHAQYAILGSFQEMDN